MSVVLTLKRSLWSWLGFPRCQSLTYLISHSMDEEQSFRDRFVINLHFLGCRKCARYQKQLRVMREALKLTDDAPVALRAESRTESMNAQTMDRMKNVLTLAATQNPETKPRI